MRIVKYLPAVIFWLIVWELAAFFVDSAIILVSPRTTIVRLFEISQSGLFWRSIFTSFLRIMQGFLLALCIGTGLAGLSARFKITDTLFTPAISFINAIPIASFTIIALMAMRSVYLPVFVAFVTVLPIIYINTQKGINSADRDLLEMAAVFRVPAWKKMLYIYVKSAAPFVASGASVGIGFAWKSGIAAELIGLVQGTIGASLHQARIFLQTPDVFAWTIAIVILSFIMERLLRLIFGKAGKEVRT